MPGRIMEFNLICVLIVALMKPGLRRNGLRLAPGAIRRTETMANQRAGPRAHTLWANKRRAKLFVFRGHQRTDTTQQPHTRAGYKSKHLLRVHEYENMSRRLLLLPVPTLNIWMPDSCTSPV